jgi:hypothetical protein
MKKPKLIEEPEKPVKKKKKNRKRWHKRKICPQTRHPLILTRPLRSNKRKHLCPRMNDHEPDKKVSVLSLAFIYRISLVASHLNFQ